MESYRYLINIDGTLYISNIKTAPKATGLEVNCLCFFNNYRLVLEEYSMLQNCPVSVGLVPFGVGQLRLLPGQPCTLYFFVGFSKKADPQIPDLD